MNLEEIFYLVSIITDVLLIGLFVVLIYSLVSLYSEVRSSLLAIKQAAALAGEKSVISLPPLNTSFFVFNFIKNLLKNERQKT